jgi:2-keto-4-pentenoate hydratase
MGGPLISMARLANRMIAHGKHLQAGDIILSGSVHPPQFLAGPGIAKTEFVGLGGVSVTVK